MIDEKSISFLRDEIISPFDAPFSNFAINTVLFHTCCYENKISSRLRNGMKVKKEKVHSCASDKWSNSPVYR